MAEALSALPSGAAGDPGNVTLRWAALSQDRDRLRFVQHRALDLEAVLRGMPVDAVPALMARILPVCGFSHAVAAATALEAISGDNRKNDDVVASRRRAMVVAESAVQQLWRALITWPSLTSQTCDPEPLRFARRAMARLARGSNADHPFEEIASALREAVVGDAPAAPCDFADWARRSPAPIARLARYASRRFRGSGPLAAPTAPSAQWLAQERARDAGFAAHPTLAGSPASFGAIAAIAAGHRAACAAFGPVGGRFLAAIPQARETIRVLEGATALPTFDVEVDSDRGASTVVVPTARGPLAHWYRVEAGRVVAFGYLAPTTWLFHPRGELVHVVGAVPDEHFERDAALALAAFDPCLPIGIEQTEPCHA